MATTTYTFKTWDEAHEAMHRIWATGINCFTRFEYVSLTESKVHVTGFARALEEVAMVI